MSQAIDCCDVWPTNMLMLEAAKTMAPQHSEKLQELLLLTEKGMSCKAEMDTYIAAWFNSYNLECLPFSEWPTNPNNFLCCWGSSPEEKKLDLNRLWELAGEGYRAKLKMDGIILRILDSRYQSSYRIELDAVIVKILDGTFEGDLFDATPTPPPKVPRSLYYNHHHWPSPRAKLFVQEMRKRYTYPKGPVWSDEFKALWLSAGNTEYKLTHDNCLRYLAYRYGTTLEAFLGRTPTEVNKHFFGEYFGVPGFFSKRMTYY